MEADTSEPFKRLRKNWLGDYARKFIHRSKEVVVSFDAKAKEELEPLLPTAERFWRSRAKWFKKFHDYAVENFLEELNNRKPDDEDIACLTKAELSKCVSVPFSVIFYYDESNDCCEFHISGGETKKMFDYIIQARCSLKSGFIDWELVSLI